MNVKQKGVQVLKPAKFAKSSEPIRSWLPWIEALFEFELRIHEEFKATAGVKSSSLEDREEEAVSAFVWSAAKTDYLALSEIMVAKSDGRKGRLDLWMKAKKVDFYFEFKLAYRNPDNKKCNLEKAMNLAVCQLEEYDLDDFVEKYAVVVAPTDSISKERVKRFAYYEHIADYVFLLNFGSRNNVYLYFKKLISKN